MNLRARVRLPSLAAALATAGLVAAGGGAAGNAQATTAASPAKRVATVTLNVWDQEVRGGQATAIKKLNAQFEKQYPNIKINRTAKSFTDLLATLKLAASGPNPPDVVEANNGYSAMGPLVEAKLLMPLDAYSAKNGWRNRYSPGILRMNRFTRDGKSFGRGSLFGLPMTGEVVGVYYNKAKLRQLGIAKPTTFPAFEAALAKAKAAGETPIQFGNLDKWPGIHTYEEPMLQFVSKDFARSWIFGSGGRSFDTVGTRLAATKVQDWARKGYFTDGYAGLGYDPSWAQFGKGNGVFLITGSWLTADLRKALGKDVGFFLLPARAGGSLSTLGGEGLPWAISSKTKNADAAATYLNFLTRPQNAQLLISAGQLPAMKGTVKVPAGLDTEVYRAWTTANARDAIVPYLDWATPTMYDTITASIQKLMAGKSTPAKFVDEIQSDYSKFHKGGR
jgi:raffinose/stachyose/melibiose transport system substrate-binding protein